MPDLAMITSCLVQVDTFIVHLKRVQGRLFLIVGGSGPNGLQSVVDIRGCSSLSVSYQVLLLESFVQL
jgi:hypothetical protein